MGESKVSMARGSRRAGRPGGLYGDTHQVPRVEKDLQVAARVWLELESEDLCWVETFLLVSD